MSLVIFWQLFIQFCSSSNPFQGFYTYSDLLLKLESYSQAEDVSLISIGLTPEGNLIKSLRVNENKDFRCLVIGGLRANEIASTLQVMDILEQLMLYKSSLNADLWLIPLLEIDGYLDLQRNDTISEKNNFFNTFQNEIDLNINLNTTINFGNKGKCDENIQDQPEMQFVKELIEKEKFDVIISYHTGDKKYIVPQSNQAPFEKQYKALTEMLPVRYEDNTGSLTDWAGDNKILGISAYVSSDQWPIDPLIFHEKTIDFFKVLSKIGPDLVLYSKRKWASLEISVENNGFFESKDTWLYIESSIYMTSVSIKNKNSIEKLDCKTMNINIPLEPIESFGKADILVLFNKFDQNAKFNIYLHDRNTILDDDSFFFDEKYGDQRNIFDAKLLGIIGCLILGLVFTVQVVSKGIRNTRKRLKVPKINHLYF